MLASTIPDCVHPLHPIATVSLQGFFWNAPQHNYLGILSCFLHLLWREILDLSVLQCHDTWGESDGVKYNSVNNILSHQSLKCI